MSFAAVYIVSRFFYRVFEFIRHWYWGGFLTVTHRTLNVLEKLDRMLAVRITFRYWLSPLYQDYSVIGYVLGFIFRTSRIFIGSAVYFCIIIAAAAVYLAWALAPFFIIYWIIKL